MLLKSGLLSAQEGKTRLFEGGTEVLNSALYQVRSGFHPDIKPYPLSEVLICVNPDTIFGTKKPAKPFLRYITGRNILQAGQKKVRFTADPLVDLSGGWDFSGNRAVYKTGLGLNAMLRLGKKVAIGGDFMISQAAFPGFLNPYVENRRIVPGEGMAFGSPAGGYGWHRYSFYASYNFLKYFTVEAGMGRNFWGDGYRSLFLSDNAYSYPYFKIITNVWHIKYVVMWAGLKDMSRTVSSRWKNMDNKYGAFHYLSWDISPRVNLGFFEAIIWQQQDSTGTRGFDISYLNPVIFFRPVEFSRGSPDNSLLGLSLRVKVGRKTSLYGQFLIDDIIVGEAKDGILNRIRKIFHPSDSTLTYGYWTNKQAWQIGVRSYDMFRVKNLSGLLEFNFARPYTWAHRLVIQNYGHYNEPLAHPSGANFRETSAFLWYSYRRWFFELHFNYTVAGLDTLNSDFGQDIYKPAWDVYEADLNNIPVKPYFNRIAQGIKTYVCYSSAGISYLVNPENNLRFTLTYSYRSSESYLRHVYGNVISIGIKMSVPDRHYDFAIPY